MAETKTTKELNLDEKVTIRNIAGWNVGFSRRVDGYGDVMISPEGSIRLSRNEIIAQVQNGNKLFTGTDGKGSHATLVIEDIPTRVEVEFETEDGKIKQDVFSEAKVKDLFTLKTMKSFESKFKEAIFTRAEKYAVITVMKKLKVNDYDKIRFVEDYTGYRMK